MFDRLEVSESDTSPHTLDILADRLSKMFVRITDIDDFDFHF